MKLLVVLLLLFPASSYFQLTDPVYATYFDSTIAPITIDLSGTPAHFAYSTASYSLFLWARVHELPTSELALATFQDAQNYLLGIAMLPDGSIKGSAGIWGMSILETSVIPNAAATPQWLFLAAVASSDTQPVKLSLTVVSWVGTVFSSEATSYFFFSFDSASITLSLGGTSLYSVKVRPTQGQFLSVQLDFEARDASQASDIVAAISCYTECDFCDGPGDKACLNFIQLGDEIKMTTETGAVHEWALDNPITNGRDLTQSSYTFTGWFYLTDLSQPRYNLFQTVITDSGTDYHLLAIYVNSAPSFTFSTDTDTTSNHSQDMPLAVIFTQTSPVNSWYFVGISLLNSLLSFCYAAYSDSSATCSTLALTGTARTFGASSDNWIRIGDSSLALFVGQMGDLRYYFKSAKTTAEISTLFTTRKAVLLTGCSTVTSPFDCSACADRFYLVGTVCQRFNLQPLSANLCLTTCPRGYAASSGTCVVSGLSHIRLLFLSYPCSVTDADSPGYTGNCGQSIYDGPNPSSSRGYYFTNARLIKLPPDPESIGTPMIFSVSPSFSAWIRRDTYGDPAIYSKQIGDTNMFAVLIDSSGQIEFSGGAPFVSYSHPTVIPFQVWKYIGLKFDYTSATGMTSITFYFDGVADATTYTAQFCIKDSSLTASQTIGALMMYASPSELFVGFMWEVVMDANGGHLDNISPAGCPANAASCLSTCMFKQEPSSCLNCRDDCWFGCTRTTDCGICMDALCAACPSTIASDCTTCVDNATLLPPCTCNTGYFPNIGNNSCDQCPINCTVCTAEDNCTACVPLASVDAGACTCKQGADPDTGACIECQSPCLKCAGVSSDQCMLCPGLAGLVAAAPSACMCISGYFGSPSNCQACHATCSTCSVGPDANQCDSCKFNAQLDGTLPGTCKCVIGSFSSPDARNCVTCHPFCLTCNGATETSCVLCKTNAVPSTATLGTCECIPGFHPSPDVSNCTDCDDRCQTCSGSTSFDCLLCKPHAVLSGSSPSPCTCVEHYYPNPDVSVCTLCHASCKACLGAGSLQCTSCLLGAALIAASPNSCTCSVGYYTSTDACCCQVCAPSCTKCSTAADRCSECKLRAHFVGLSPGPCACDTGYYISNSQCAACDDTCLTCSGAGPTACTSCISTSYINGSICVCNSNTYRLGKDCVTCSGQCFECVNESTLGCSNCKENAVLSGSPPNSCQCITGARRETEDGPCVKCVNYYATSDLKAYIDSTFMKMVITFPLAVSISYDLYFCNKIFVPESLEKLGYNPACIWSIDRKSLTVLLGAAYLLRSETITLVASNIGSVDGNCTAVQQVLALKVTYESPRLPPVAVISAPMFFTPQCESVLKLSGSRSTGFAGQTGLYKWKLTLMPSLQEIDTYKNYSDANADILLPSSLLSDKSLNATLFVSDGFNLESVVYQTVTFTNYNTIVVTLDATSPLKTYRTRSVKIESSSRFTCAGPTTIFEYRWEQLTGSPTMFTALYSYLYISPGQLIPQNTYIYRVNVAAAGIRGSANVTLSIIPSQLQIRLDRSDGQQDAGSDLVINATGSYDPDNSTIVLKYFWTCAEGTESCKDKDGNDLTLNATAAVVVKSDKLRVTAKYFFTLKVSADVRSQAISITIEIVPPGTIQISIPTSTSSTPPGLSTVVYPSVTSTATAIFQWSQLKGPPVTISTPSNIPWIKIAGNQLVSGESYQFALTVTTAKGSLVQYLATSVNNSPAYGRLTVNQTIGQAIIDDFWFQAPYWDDPDGTDYPLTYQYGIVPLIGTSHYLTGANLNIDFVAYFFPGMLTIIVKVCDSLRSCSIADTQIRVTMPKIDQRRLQIASLAIAKRKFNNEVKTTANIPCAIMNYAMTLGLMVDAELYTFMFTAAKTYINFQPYIDNPYFANQLTCCVYMLGLTHLINSTVIRDMSNFVTGSISMMVEDMTDENMNKVLGLFVNLKAKASLTSEIKRFYAIMYAYLSLIPDDLPTTITGSAVNITAKSVIATDSKSLNTFANNVGLQFPDTFLSDMNIADGTKCDIRVEVHNNNIDPTPTVTINLARSGLFNGLQLTSTQPQSLTPVALSSPINITIPVNKLIPGIPYTAIAQAENSVKWSTAGVNLAIISYASVIVSAYHFSSFKVVPRETVSVAFGEWPELMEKPGINCGETYAPIIFADLQIVFLIVCYVAVGRCKRIHSTSSQFQLSKTNRITEIENDDLKTSPKHSSRSDTPRDFGKSNPRLRPVELNLVFGFITGPTPRIRLMMAIALFQCENISLGVANKIRFGDWETDIDPEIDFWGGFDFLCCVSALIVGQFFGWLLLAIYLHLKIRSLFLKRVFTAIVVILSIMMNSALMWMSTTGCDGVLNRWTAEAIAVMIAELTIVSWLSTLVSKYISFSFEMQSFDSVLVL